MADTRIKDVSHSLLTNLGAALTTAGIDVPSRAYITTGLPALDYPVGNEDPTTDCGEQFVVSWLGMLTVSQLGQTIKCATPFVGRFVVGLFRCVPTIDSDGVAPDTADLTASGDELSIDAMTLCKVIVDQQLNRKLLDNTCAVISVGNVLAYGPAGGIGGVTVELLVELF